MLQADRELVQLFWGYVVSFFWFFAATGGLFLVFHWSRPRLRLHYQDVVEGVANVCGGLAILACGMMLFTSAATYWFCATALKDPVVWVRAGR